jgi:hypothetical protein
MDGGISMGSQDEVRFRPNTGSLVQTKEGLLAATLEQLPLRWSYLPSEMIEITANRHLSRPGPDVGFRAYFDAQKATAPEVVYHRLRDCRFYARPGGFVRLSDGSFLAETRLGRWSNKAMKDVAGVSYDPDADKVYVSAEEPPLRTLNDGLYLIGCHVAWRNYGHFILDCLSSIAPFLDEIRAGQIKLVIAPIWHEWQRSLYDLLGVPRDAIVEVNEFEVLLQDAIFPSTLSAAGTRCAHRLIADTFRVLRRNVESLPGPHPSLGGRLYLRRTEKRMLRQQQELERELVHLGFAVMEPEKYSIPDQIAIFSAATVIVGTFGAEFTNIGFADPGCTIIEIRTDVSDDPWSMHLSAQMGHQYTCIAGKLDRDQIGWTKVGDRDYMGTQIIDIDTGYIIDVVRQQL